MKKTGTLLILLALAFVFRSCGNSSDPTSWNEDQINKWFEESAYLNGWSVKPDVSVNKREFAIAYNKNKERWDKAFAFLKNTDLASLEAKRHDIDGDNVYAIVSESVTKNPEDAKFEAHKRYADIQHLISGSELMSVTPVTKKGEVLSPYDETKDLEFMTVSESSDYIGTPDNFLLFFPSELHRPGVKVGENAPVKKIVVKVKL